MIAPDDVAAALGIAPASAADTAWLQSATDAANAYVMRLPQCAGGAVWSADTITGAIMLAVRLYHSRSAPLGAAGTDVAGGLVRASTDPEIGRLLRIGRYTAPAAG